MKLNTEFLSSVFAAVDVSWLFIITSRQIVSRKSDVFTLLDCKFLYIMKYFVFWGNIRPLLWTMNNNICDAPKGINFITKVGLFSFLFVACCFVTMKCHHHHRSICYALALSKWRIFCQNSVKFTPNSHQMSHIVSSPLPCPPSLPPSPCLQREFWTLADLDSGSKVGSWFQTPPTDIGHFGF